MVFTRDEEKNLPHCLGSLSPSDDIIIIDSYSEDRTCEIGEQHGARIFQHRFTGFGDQRNWALDNTAPRHDWVLILDADERVPDVLWNEIARTLELVDSDVAAFRLKRRFFMWGKWLRYSSLYPTWVVRLVRHGKVRYINRGHAETQYVDGTIGALSEDLIDENHKSVADWLERQKQYAARDAEYELLTETVRLQLSDGLCRDPLRRRAFVKQLAARLPSRGALMFIYLFVFRFGFLDGREGFMFCRFKATHQALVAAKKIELREQRRA